MRNERQFEPQFERPIRYMLCLLISVGMTCNFANAQLGLALQNRQDAVKMWILGGQTEDDYQKRIKSSCDLVIAELKRVLKEKSIDLKPDQETRLDLAREGTASQFLADIVQYQALTGTMNMNDPNDQQKALQILQGAMMESQQGWYGKNYFDKLLKSVLNAEQHQAYADYRRERTEKMHRILVLRLVSDLTEPLALTKAQREQLVDVLNKQPVKELPPNYGSIIVYIKILRVPDKKFEEFLDPKQADVLTRMAAPYQGIEGQFQ